MSAKRVSQERLHWLAARLSDRDRRVLRWLADLRLATGQQLETLTFTELRDHSRSVVRGRVLARLVRWGLIELVDRRIGGAASGSTSGIYRLSHAGQVLLTPAAPRATKPYTPRFTEHTLATAQLAADLVQAKQMKDFSLPVFVTEPASWVPDGLGNYLKPDAYLQLQTAALTLHWWVEIDRGSESLPTLERKLHTYLNFIARGQRGPHDLVPRVLVVVPDDRLEAVQRLVERSPAPAADLFVVTNSGRAIVTLLAELDE